MRRLLLGCVVLLAACRSDDALTTRWRWDAPPPAYTGMPASDRGDVAATYGHAALVLIDNRGHQRWRAERIGLRDVSPAFGGDAVVAATDEGVAAFGRADGRPRWERALGDRPSAPVLGDGVVVVTTWDGRMIAVDRWSIELPGPGLGPPAVAGRTAVASWDTGVLAADLDNGALLWRHEFAAVGTSAPAVGRGIVVVVGGDRRAHAFDLRTGEQRWSFATAGAGSPEAPPAVHGGLVAVADRLGHVTVADVATGGIRWQADGDGAVERGGPVFAGDAVVLPLDDGRLMVATERRRRFLDPPGRVSGVTRAGPGTVVYATREAGTNGLTALAM